jgi:hypothetical protein
LGWLLSKDKRQELVRVWRKGNAVNGNINWYYCYEKQCGASSKNLKTELPSDPAIPLLGTCPQEMKVSTSYCSLQYYLKAKI